ncbi:hypothetical protein PMAYCL1PPCAC_10346, partial [Pristionchus mayeri]
RESTATLLLTPVTGTTPIRYLISTGGPIYFALFIYRHQLIVPVESRLKLSVHARIIFLLILAIPYSSLGISFY